MSYIKINVATLELLEPGLPVEFQGLDASSLADMGWYSPTPPAPPAGLHPGDQWAPGPDNPGWGPGPLAGFGFWPLVELPTPVDAATEQLGDATSFEVDAASKRVTFTRAVIPLTPEQLAARAPKPVELTKLQFRELVVGIVGLAVYQSVRTNPALFLANDTLALASVIRPADMPDYWALVLGAGLIGQDQVDAIMAAWPTA